MPFDPLTDFTSVSLLSSAATMLAIHPSVQARSVRELIELARAKPGALNFSTAGAGTNPHIAAELFNQLAGINTVAIHFKGGGPGLLAALAGDTQIIFAGVSEAAPHVAAGKLRSLGITSPKRSGAFPDMPTIAESGLPGYEFVTWHGLLAPRSLPAALVSRVGERVRRVMAAPDFVKVFQQNGAGHHRKFARRVRVLPEIRVGEVGQGHPGTRHAGGIALKERIGGFRAKRPSFPAPWLVGYCGL